MSSGGCGAAVTADGANVFFTFIVPVLIFILIAGALGFALAYLGEKIKVERDPKIDDVSRFLAGVNCGGCGCAGCDAFAEALVSGKAKLSQCNPTSAENKDNIAKILGQSGGASKRLVAVVHCNGGNKCRDKHAYQGFGDCQSAELLAGGNKACRVGCMGLGSCNEYCKYGAVSVDKDTGVAVVDGAKCTACGMCVSICPKKIISRIPFDAKVYVACSNTWRGKDVRSVCENGCIACGLCEKKCPAEAIRLSNNLAIIDYDKCTACGACVSVCPSKCIHNYAG
ncbi:MAG: RnfABCDGE type electron transport complex subunit B [Clostridiales bacterium]|jgi:Na+-translocating ferredoxin:NAD+ oxidoreductase RNF subunit RnfB|nr:RnfABCDGE type electron transport complex subunit B [Clostridiales bacterium]